MTQCSLQKMRVTYKKLVSVFDSVYKKGENFKVNASKSKVTVCERSRNEVVDFVRPYRVGIECEKECKITLNGEEMEEFNEFKYLGSVMCKHGGTEGEARERALHGRKVVGSLGRIMKGRSVSMKVKRDLRNTVILQYQPSHMQVKHGPGMKVRGLQCRQWK